MQAEEEQREQLHGGLGVAVAKLEHRTDALGRGREAHHQQPLELGRCPRYLSRAIGMNDGQ